MLLAGHSHNELIKIIRGAVMDNINLNNIKGKKVLVVGMGRSGIAALQAMLKLGADVTVQDAKRLTRWTVSF